MVASDAGSLEPSSELPLPLPAPAVTVRGLPEHLVESLLQAWSACKEWRPELMGGGFTGPSPAVAEATRSLAELCTVLLASSTEGPSSANSYIVNPGLSGSQMLGFFSQLFPSSDRDAEASAEVVDLSGCLTQSAICSGHLVPAILTAYISVEGTNANDGSGHSALQPRIDIHNVLEVMLSDSSSTVSGGSGGGGVFSGAAGADAGKEKLNPHREKLRQHIDGPRGPHLVGLLLNDLTYCFDSHLEHVSSATRLEREQEESHGWADLDEAARAENEGKLQQEYSSAKSYKSCMDSYFGFFERILALSSDMVAANEAIAKHSSHMLCGFLRAMAGKKQSADLNVVDKVSPTAALSQRLLCAC